MGKLKKNDDTDDDDDDVNVSASVYVTLCLPQIGGDGDDEMMMAGSVGLIEKLMCTKFSSAPSAPSAPNTRHHRWKCTGPG